MSVYDKIFEPLSRGRISEKIIERITDAIISGELKPGDKIPTEVEFSEKLGIGRNSVREATKILVAYGVLEIRPSEGTFIVEEFNHRLLNPMIYGVLLKENSMLQLLELKITLLRSILYTVIEKANKDDIELLKQEQRVFEDIVEKYPENLEKIYDANLNFYKCLARMCHNPLIIEMNNIILKMSKYSRKKGIETSIQYSNQELLTKTTFQIMRVVEKKDIKAITPVINNTFELWKKLIL